MATRELFRTHWQSTVEQNLVEDLIVEAIQIFGIDVYYVRRRIDTRDGLYREDTVATFDAAYPIEMYVKSADGFEGDGKFLSKFGLEIRDQIVFTVARRAFGTHVTTPSPTHLRPREGDLIWFTVNQKAYEIKYVDSTSVFYQAGAQQVWDLKTEMFEHNNQQFLTGVPLIDTVYNAHSSVGRTPEYTPETLDSQAQNAIIQLAANNVLDLSEFNPFVQQL